MWVSYLQIAVAVGYGRSWSSDAAEDEELMQMMDNLQHCLSTSTARKLHILNGFYMLHVVLLHVFYGFKPFHYLGV